MAAEILGPGHLGRSVRNNFEGFLTAPGFSRDDFDLAFSAIRHNADWEPTAKDTQIGFDL